MNTNSKIYVPGHKGLVGSSIVRALKNQGYNNIIYADKKDLNLTDNRKVEDFFEFNKPDYVFICAAKVGGILANNDYPADFINENILIQSNLLNACVKTHVKKTVFLGSSCIYPRDCPQPIKEEYLMTGPLEKTNEWYAIAKICGIKTAQAFNKQYGSNIISLMPTNLYGENDNFDLNKSHVLPALIRKIHEAKSNNSDFVEIWGSGLPRREFLFVDDLADAAIFLMKNYNSPDIINIGTGVDLTIRDLAIMIKDVIGYKGEFKFNTSKPDGTPRKLLDVSKLFDLGWRPKTELYDGIKYTYGWYLSSYLGNHDNTSNS